MYEVNGVKYDENINTNKTNTEQVWNTQEQQRIHGNTKKQTYARKHCRRSVYKT